ncbi:alkaline-phosphatase-like protein, partial [Mucor mucedo]|uniref:alkaline-phosphatase-like protein n=1 Tax=Mucor mucedo TaxID=29922 RepID=UPI00221E40F2
MQRVKGLMTGSLPTFIDAGANFASSAVGEDHLLFHIKQKFHNMYLMGDDTWLNLFPEIFDDPSKTFASDSFKMLDLDSVDNDILSHLWTVMEGEWEVAIAHFLGVDHCGHTFGPSDPNMARKLNQMNTVMEQLLTFIDEDTLLVVMGDHGMSLEGDHGGESVEELMSTLFMHSKRPLTIEGDYYKTLHHRIHQARATRLDYDIPNISKRLSYNASQYPIVSQIHLVPTLAYLLQVPIPFGNLGAIIPDIIYPADDGNQIANLVHMVEQFRMNALQVHDYLHQYSKSHAADFSQDKTQALARHLYRAEEIMVRLTNQDQFQKAMEASVSTTNDIQEFSSLLEEAILEYDAFLISTIKYCEAIWAQFDTGCMVIGIILLISGTLSSLLLLSNKTKPTNDKSVLVLGMSALIISCSFVYLRYAVFAHFFLSKGWFEKMEVLDWVGVSLVLTLSCISLLTQHENPSKPSVYWYKYDWFVLLAGGLAQSFTLGSNSFVIWEDRGTRFALATLSFLWMIRNLQALTKYTKKMVLQSIGYPFLLLVFVRLTGLTGQCREEQFPDCVYMYSSSLEFGNHVTGYCSTAFLIASLFIVYYFSRTIQN